MAKGDISVEQAGRRGGLKVKKKYGRSYYEEIGRRGGQTVRIKYGSPFYEEIGRKGGKKSKRK